MVTNERYVGLACGWEVRHLDCNYGMRLAIGILRMDGTSMRKMEGMSEEWCRNGQQEKAAPHTKDLYILEDKRRSPRGFGKIVLHRTVIKAFDPHMGRSEDDSCVRG